MCVYFWAVRMVMAICYSQNYRIVEACPCERKPGKIQSFCFYYSFCQQSISMFLCLAVYAFPALQNNHKTFKISLPRGESKMQIYIGSTYYEIYIILENKQAAVGFSKSSAILQQKRSTYIGFWKAGCYRVVSNVNNQYA